MKPESYPVVGQFVNHTSAAFSLYLEMIPEEVILEPGDKVELLARPSAGILPLHIAAVTGGLQIHAQRDWDPDWHIRHRGKIIKVVSPTRLEHD